MKTAIHLGPRWAACWLVLLWTATTQATVIVDLEDLTLAPDMAAPADASQTPFTSHGVQFNRSWNTEFDCCPGGWAYSNRRDLQTAGVDNSFSAYALPDGGGVDGSANFAVANSWSRGEATLTLPAPSTVQGMYVTNTTYSYLAVANGDDGGANFVKGPFSAGDWFRLDIFGLDASGQETGSVPFFLADFREGQSDVVSDWTWVDLTPLGNNVQRLEFAMNSSDVGPFGMNTPAYFAMDNLTLAVVPEPTSLLLCLLGCLAVWHGRRPRG